MNTNAELAAFLISVRDARSDSDMAQQALADALKDIIPPEVQKAIDECKAEMGPMLETAFTATVTAEGAVKSWVLKHHESGREAGLEAIYCDGRTSWDTKGLEKAMKLLPALVEYRKIGHPYVTIRKATA